MFISRSTKGFTLIELLVVVSIISLLSSIVLSSLSNARSKALDAWRFAQVRQIQTALELYYNQFGVYPSPSSDTGLFVCGGWDATADGVFIPALTSNGFISTIPKDPEDSVCGNFAYYRYPVGSDNCPVSNGAFYVLGIKTLSDGGFTGPPGRPPSPGFSCGDRDWHWDFRWVTGKFENR